MGPNILFYPEDNYRYLFNSLLLTFIFIENYELSPAHLVGSIFLCKGILCHLLVLSLCFHSLLVARKIQIPTRKPIKASK